MEKLEKTIEFFMENNRIDWKKLLKEQFSNYMAKNKENFLLQTMINKSGMSIKKFTRIKNGKF